MDLYTSSNHWGVHMHKSIRYLSFFILMIFSSLAMSQVTVGPNAWVSSTANIGIGSASPGQLLDVKGTVRAGFFVGDGTGISGISGSISGLTTNLVPKAGSSTTIVNGSLFDNGNIGLGSVNPGQKLDVIGTVRSTGLIAGAGGITLGGVNNTTWPAGTSQWTSSGNDVYLPNNGNVALGTTNTTTAALTVMNGNVGIGTWVPAQALSVNGTVSATGFISSGLITGQSNYLAANVGIGTTAPAQVLDVVGTLMRMRSPNNSTWSCGPNNSGTWGCSSP